VEKPPRPLAERLMSQGAVWNSFILAATGEALLELFRHRMGRELELLRDALRTVSGAQRPARRLMRIYERLRPRDFSRDLLEGVEGRLALVRVPSCGWTDLGTPERVGQCIARRPPRPVRAGSAGRGLVRLDRAYGRALSSELASG
jgi:hypothetical protein